MAVPTPESAHSSSETPTHTPQQLFGTFRSNLKHRAPLFSPDPPTIQNTDLLLVAIALVLSSGSELWALALVWALALGSGSVLWLWALALGSGSGLWHWALALGSGLPWPSHAGGGGLVSLAAGALHRPVARAFGGGLRPPPPPSTV